MGTAEAESSVHEEMMKMRIKMKMMLITLQRRAISFEMYGCETLSAPWISLGLTPKKPSLSSSLKSCLLLGGSNSCVNAIGAALLKDSGRFCMFY